VDSIREQPAAAARADERASSLPGAALAMFLVFAGASASQFHSYLFEKRGFSGLEVGYLLAAGYGAGVLSPLIQVKVIRLFRGPRLPLMLALLLTAVTLAALPRVHGFRPLFILAFLCAFFGAAIFPLNTACTLDAVRHRGHGVFFGIRSLGTVGFLAGCGISACFTEFAHLPFLYLGFAGAYLLALGVMAKDYKPAYAGAPAEGARSGPGLRRTLELLVRGRTGRLLLVMGVMNFANGLIICIQGNYLVHRWEGGQASISQAWVASTACEAPLFLLCAWVLRRYGLRYVLAMGLAGTLAKIVGAALAAELWQYWLALAMHGFFYSGAVTGFSVYLDRHHAREDIPSLQALSVIFFQGIPNALAGLSAGLIWHASSLRSVYLFAAAIAAAVSAYGFFLLRREDRGAGRSSG
jgi:MFS family permease